MSSYHERESSDESIVDALEEGSSVDRTGGDFAVEILNNADPRKVKRIKRLLSEPNALPQEVKTNLRKNRRE